MSEVVTVYTVRRSPVTAGARVAVGYKPSEFEYVASDARQAVNKAIAECEWQNPARNFSWRVVGSKVLVLPDQSDG